MNTFENLKKIIPMRKKSKAEIMDMMDVFLMHSRITVEQYEELTELLGEKEK